MALIPFQQASGGPAQSVSATIFNNVVFNTESAFQISPQTSVDSADAAIFNNTIVRSDGCLSLYANSGTSVTGRFENNICAYSTASGGYGAINAYVVPGGTFGMSFSNNAYFSNAGGNLSTTGVSVPSIGSVVNSNPQFVNLAVGDLRLRTTSPAIDAGLTQSGYTTDLLGAVRPQGSGYDIGAYEGGVVVADASEPTAVPSLSIWALLMLSGILGSAAGLLQRRRA